MDKKKKRNIKIVIAAVLAVTILGSVFLLLHHREVSYRVIKIFSLDGSAVIKRLELGVIDAYKNMLLESGDIVSVNEGAMTLKLDEDKYVYAEKQTEFELEALGDSKNSKTKIKLNKGAITNELQSKLNGESTYEINTQNSTMSVRGTIYRVETYTDENGIVFTRVSVFEGSVAVRLIYPNGEVADDETIIDKGKEVIIYEDASTTDYLTGVRDIVYDDLPVSVINLLKERGLNTGQVQENTSEPDEKTEDISGTTENTSEATENTNEPTENTSKTTEDKSKTTEEADVTFKVTFMYNGNIFGTQQVKKGDCAQKPVLMPASSGSWNFDFSTPITKDTVIEWNLS